MMSNPNGNNDNGERNRRSSLVVDPVGVGGDDDSSSSSSSGCILDLGGSSSSAKVRPAAVAAASGTASSSSPKEGTKADSDAAVVLKSLCTITSGGKGEEPAKEYLYVVKFDDKSHRSAYGAGVRHTYPIRWPGPHVRCLRDLLEFAPGHLRPTEIDMWQYGTYEEDSMMAAIADQLDEIVSLPVWESPSSVDVDEDEEDDEDEIAEDEDDERAAEDEELEADDEDMEAMEEESVFLDPYETGFSGRVSAGYALYTINDPSVRDDHVLVAYVFKARVSNETTWSEVFDLDNAALEDYGCGGMTVCMEAAAYPSTADGLPRMRKVWLSVYHPCYLFPNDWT